MEAIKQREVKFRIYDTERKEYVHEPFFRITIANNGKIYNSENDEWYLPNSRYIIQFYTGLKDKNGKEIFDGDIITCEIYERENQDEYSSGVPIKVEWSKECSGFYPFIKASQWRSSVEEVEIIGNIYTTSLTEIK